MIDRLIEMDRYGERERGRGREGGGEGVQIQTDIEANNTSISLPFETYSKVFFLTHHFGHNNLKSYSYNFH